MRTDPENDGGTTSGRASPTDVGAEGRASPTDVGRAAPPEGGAEVNSVDELRTRDEILELMFWMGTQGLGELVTIAEIIRFVPLSEAAAQRHLAELGALGLVEVDSDNTRWRLSVVGEAEARHRFADVLADLVGVLGHGASCGADCTDDHEPHR